MTEVSVTNSKGLASAKDMPVLQDGPPPGGYSAVRYARKIPSTGPRGAGVALVSCFVIAFGFYQVGQGNIHRRALKAEKIAARRSILPLIQAEEDLRYVKERNDYLEEERRIMAHIPDWNAGASVYNSGRWMPPSTGKLMSEYLS